MTSVVSRVETLLPLRVFFFHLFFHLPLSLGPCRAGRAVIINLIFFIFPRLYTTFSHLKCWGGSKFSFLWLSIPSVLFIGCQPALPRFFLLLYLPCNPHHTFIGWSKRTVLCEVPGESSTWQPCSFSPLFNFFSFTLVGASHPSIPLFASNVAIVSPVSALANLEKENNKLKQICARNL